MSTSNSFTFEKLLTENYSAFFVIVLIFLVALYFINKKTACTIIDIDIESIATQDPEQGWFVLNEGSTISECQRLNIRFGTQLRIAEGQTLTNHGTIIVRDLHSSIQTLNLIGLKGVTLNNIGSITISDGAYIINDNRNFNGQEGGTIMNSGSIVISNSNSNTSFISNSNNSNYRDFNSFDSVTAGLAGGIIKNTGTIIIEVGGEIDNRNSVVDDRVSNYNNTKGGIIYIYGGGKIENYGTILASSSGNALGGTISRTEDDSSGCGVGTFDPVGNLTTGGIFDNVCPPL
jgi:hypothetical protein